jgi:acyl-CoA synthetase (AMP-forming)/AMP-acid ligase II
MNAPMRRDGNTIMGLPPAAPRAQERIGVVAVNNPGYSEAVFSCFAAGAVAVPLRSAEDTERIRSAGVNRIITPANGAARRPTNRAARDADNDQSPITTKFEY